LNEETGCLEWTGARQSAGYGHLGITTPSGVRWFLVHRVIYEAQSGPIPEGMTLDHLCLNIICANVAHLEVVTASENLRRAAAHRRPDACPRGHAYDETTVNAKGALSCPICARASRAAYRARQAIPAEREAFGG